jgi:hypothetical protein
MNDSHVTEVLQTLIHALLGARDLVQRGLCTAETGREKQGGPFKKWHWYVLKYACVCVRVRVCVCVCVRACVHAHAPVHGPMHLLGHG